MSTPEEALTPQGKVPLAFEHSGNFQRSFPKPPARLFNPCQSLGVAGQQGSASSAPAHTPWVLFGLCVWGGCAVLGGSQCLSVPPQPIGCCHLLLGGSKVFITVPSVSQQGKGCCEQRW